MMVMFDQDLANHLDHWQYILRCLDGLESSQNFVIEYRERAESFVLLSEEVILFETWLF